MSFPAFFDTCALFGAVLNDVFLRLADAGAYRPLWSEDVLDELRRNLLRNGAGEGAVGRRVAAMRTAFPDAMVTGFEDLVDRMTCDRKDRHVLAAAVRANAEVVVTFNPKDFPAQSTEPNDVDVVHPDEFLLDQLDLYPGLVVRVLKELVEDYRDPAVSMDELLQRLSRSVPRFAQDVRRHL